MTNFGSMFEKLREETKSPLTLSPREQAKLVQNFHSAKNIDLIWAHGDPLACCLAVNAGWLYGFNASYFPCSKYLETNRHSISFIDNPYKDYNHKEYLSIVRKIYDTQGKIKYVTVRDIMTEKQCQKAKIKYFNLSQVLEYAESLEPYVENVIVIPKYDCIKDIPERFMLGFSTPSSFGGTELPIALFKERRVHILGGPPNKQIALADTLGNSVISIDGNYLHRIAGLGEVWLANGKSHVSLSSMVIEGLKIDEQEVRPSNVMYIALAISLGMFSNYFAVRTLNGQV